jgi:hypothetical protein
MSGSDVQAQILEVMDDADVRSVSRAYGDSFCGYPTRRACFADTIRSGKFWAVISAFLILFIMLLVLDIKNNESRTTQKALAFLLMQQIEHIENLTHDCICGQWICQASNDTIIRNTPVQEGRTVTHAKRDAQRIRESCSEMYSRLEKEEQTNPIPINACETQLEGPCGFRLSRTLCQTIKNRA